MSDTLVDFTSCLPSEFLTAVDIPINKTHFPSNHQNYRRHPYDFGSPSSTESESDDDDLAGLTHRLTRSVSLQERLQIPFHVQKRVFSSSPESTLNWNGSYPATPLVHSDKDSLERIYDAVGQIARMKMNMINPNGDVFANRNIHVPQRANGLALNHRHHHPNCSNWNRENEEFIRQQQLLQRLNYGSCGGGSVTNRPVEFRQSAWPPLAETPRRQLPVNAFVNKHVLPGSAGGDCRGSSAVKKECAGTGVFLPRTSYSHAPQESMKKPACPGGHLPARLVGQSYNKTMDPIYQQPQPNMYFGSTPHHQVPLHHLNRAELAEIVLQRRHAAMLSQQRRSTNRVAVVPETKNVGHPEIVLPQEWTY